MSFKAKVSGGKKYKKVLDQVIKHVNAGFNIFIGVPADSANYPKTGQSVAYVAAIHEFGLGRQTEKAFLRRTFAENQKKYNKLFVDAIRNSVKKKKPIKLYAQAIGQIAQDDVKDMIFSIGLLDTGHLVSSVRYEVKDDKDVA